MLWLSSFGVFALFAAFLYGTAMSYAVFTITSRKRGRAVELMAVGSTIGGLFAAVLLGWGANAALGELVNPWFILTVVISGYTAYNRSKYI